MSSRALVLVLIVVAIVFTLPATITGNSILGWIGAAAFILAILAYVRWRREVRRGRVLDR